MLSELHIRDLGVIAAAALTLEPGLNVLTGETGAGKTMVVTGLELLLGARADADRIRPGAGTALVEGVFRPPPPDAADWVDAGDTELLAAREVTAEGGGTRSRARLQGRLAPASALASALGPSCEVHGQHEHVRLADPAVQRRLLDRFGGAAVASALHDYQEAYRRWRSAAAELDNLRATARDRVREADRLAFELNEIDEVAPEPGEEAALDREATRLEHAERLQQAAAAAAAAIADEGGARDGLGACVALLRDVAALDRPLEQALQRAEGLAVEAQELALDLEAYAQDVESDPQRLEQIRERRAALARLLRKYGEDTAAVIAYAEDARRRLEGLHGGEQRLAALDAEVAELENAVTAAGAALRQARHTAGERLAAAVGDHLAELAMPQARLVVDVAGAPPGPDGADRLTLLLAANPGQPPLPVATAASGGERSRVALAVRLALADADDTAVLVFDEVDAGIGGETALAVGRKLAALARGRQVLCVTHLAQLAAFADAHFRIAKAVGEGVTSAVVERLSGETRLRELSRMLAGTGTETAVAHAAELLAQAGQARP